MNKSLMGAICAAALLLAGCGEKKCFFVSQDGAALERNAPVVWYDAYVGRVDSLGDAAGGTKVEFHLDKKFAGEIHDGVSGRVVKDPKISPKAFVLLVGGRDKERSLLAEGSQIPESRPGNAVSEGFAAFAEWLKNSRADELKVVGALLLFLFVLIKFVGKLFKLALFVAILCVVGYVCVSANLDWSSYKERLADVGSSAQEAKSWLQDHGEKLRSILETALEAE